MAQIPGDLEDFEELSPDRFYEAVRLEALRRCDIVDSPNDYAYERLVILGKDMLEVDYCAISLLTDTRQWLKASVNLPFCETARDISICQWVIQERAPVMIADTTLDPRTNTLPGVLGDPFIRSYAGHPLVSHDGFILGTFCVSHTKTRVFGELELKLLETLAKVISAELQLRELALSLTGDAPPPLT